MHHRKRGAKRWGNTVAKAVEAAKIRRQGAAASVSPNPLESFDEEIELTAQEFADLLSTIDRGLRALPATAQVRTHNACTPVPQPLLWSALPAAWQ